MARVRSVAGVPQSRIRKEQDKKCGTKNDVSGRLAVANSRPASRLFSQYVYRLAVSHHRKNGTCMYCREGGNHKYEYKMLDKFPGGDIEQKTPLGKRFHNKPLSALSA